MGQRRSRKIASIRSFQKCFRRKHLVVWSQTANLSIIDRYRMQRKIVECRRAGYLDEFLILVRPCRKRISAEHQGAEGDESFSKRLSENFHAAILSRTSLELVILFPFLKLIEFPRRAGAKRV